MRDEAKPDINQMPGLKFDDIQPCAECGRGLMHDNKMFFYRTTIEQGVFDLNAIRRMAGLEMMMGGAAPLARAFSPDTVCARFMPPVVKMICGDCFLKSATLVGLAEDGESAHDRKA